jgi:glycine cleavage system regulatory protein
MNAYKTILTVTDSRQLVVNLPKNFEGTHVEVIVLNVSDEAQMPSSKPVVNFRQQIQSPMNIEAINTQLDKIRNEWQNDFS